MIERYLGRTLALIVHSQPKVVEVGRCMAQRPGSQTSDSGYSYVAARHRDRQR